MNKKQFLWIEFTSIFIALPICLFLINIPLNGLVVPILLFLSLAAFVILYKDPTFNKTSLYKLVTPKLIWNIVFRWLVGINFLLLLTYYTNKNLLFRLPKEDFTTWLMVIILYPLFSVYPQELIYRGYFFHRYREIFKDKFVIIIMSGLSFGIAHLIFQNVVAPILSAFGGIMFARTYSKSNSLILSVIEHGLWGDLIFTIGLGYYFYSGNIN